MSVPSMDEITDDSKEVPEAATPVAASAEPMTEPASARIRIKIKAYDYKLVDQAAKQIAESVIRTGARVFGPVPLPTERKRYTVNSSTFVHKDARDQYEIRVHKRLIDIQNFSAKTVGALQSLQIPAGVDLSMK
jgi:small subunit ribosomal protein S10